MISRREFLGRCIIATAGLVTTRTAVAQLSCASPAGQPMEKGSFLRKYDEAEGAVDETALQRLAELMTSTADPPNAARLFPGYTYFGQFIDHDLTWNRTPFDAAYEDQKTAKNFRSPFLDLDSVYGDGPPLDCQFTGSVGAESFLIGPTAPSPNLGLNGGTLCDIPFENGNRPVLGDRIDLRNAENLIVRQLHVVFLKFHNGVIAQLPQHSKDPSVPQDGTLFERARRLVTWTYQWLVWNDFLYTLCPKATPPRKLQRLDELPREPFRLPLEFVLAGFRFGHSMVQGRYALNCYHRFDNHTAVDLIRLLNASTESAERLTEEFAIEWRRFFPGLGKKPTNASKIDTHINPALGSLPGAILLMFNKPSRGDENQNLAYRTLLRGARARLASGQQVASKIKERDHTTRDISKELKQDRFLQESQLSENTPLWYYILKEAEVDQYGDALGKVGFYIAEDAIEGALQNDPNSFLVQKGNTWKPPGWILPDERQTMAELIKFAGADHLVEGCTR
jgi:hypothetical protein